MKNEKQQLINKSLQKSSDMNSEKPEAIRQERSVSIQILLCLIAYLTSIAPSMSIGFSAVALPPLLSDQNPYRLTPGQASWFASIASVATPVGCFISGPISDRYGRKNALMMVNISAFIGWVIISIAYQFPAQQFTILLIGRIFTGLSTGLTSMPPAVYLAEISSPKLRGMFTTANGLFFALGVMIVYILGWIFQDNWGIISTITAVIPICAVVGSLIFLPESPPWLVAKGRVEEATRSMCKIYGYKEENEEVYEDIQALIRNRDASKINSTKKKTIFTTIKKKIDYLLKPTCFKPFVLVMVYFFFQQFSGTFVIVFYAIDIVKAADVKIDPYKAIVLIAFTRLVGAFLVSYVSKKYGRRPPSILSGIGMTACMMILSLHLYLKDSGSLDASTLQTFSWIPLFTLTMYFFTSTLGFLTIPFAMSAECFPAKIRGTASGLITCIAYTFNFIIVKIFPAMLEAMMPYGLFLFYGVLSLIGTIFIITLLPETKGKTLAEIEEYFAGKKKQRNIITKGP